MNKTPHIYGAAPVDLGLVDLNPTEMMFWLYCPIKLSGGPEESIPDNLRQFEPLVEAAYRDMGYELYEDSYVYITAKTLWVTPEAPGNRPGWHSDGFLTDDLNYIWCDSNPTVFYEDGERHSFSADHKDSIPEMDALCEDERYQKTYPVKHLLRLDQTVLHKVNTNIPAGMRTFVKISVSDSWYGLKGNSVNHDLDTPKGYKDRDTERNCPIGGK